MLVGLADWLVAELRRVWAFLNPERRQDAAWRRHAQQVRRLEALARVNQERRGYQ